MRFPCTVYTTHRSQEESSQNQCQSIYTILRNQSKTRVRSALAQIWSHCGSNSTCTPHPELRRGAASAGVELPTAEAGPGGTLCTSHAPAASPRPLARTPRTKRKRRRNEADLPVQGCLPGFPLTSDKCCSKASEHDKRVVTAGFSGAFKSEIGFQSTCDSVSAFPAEEMILRSELQQT